MKGEKEGGAVKHDCETLILVHSRFPVTNNPVTNNPITNIPDAVEWSRRRERDSRRGRC